MIEQSYATSKFLMSYSLAAASLLKHEATDFSMNNTVRGCGELTVTNLVVLAAPFNFCPLQKLARIVSHSRSAEVKFSNKVTDDRHGWTHVEMFLVFSPSVSELN